MVVLLSLSFVAASVIAAIAIWFWQQEAQELATIFQRPEAVVAGWQSRGSENAIDRQGVLQWLERALDQPTARPAVVRFQFVALAEEPGAAEELAVKILPVLKAAVRGARLVARVAPGEYVVAFDGAISSAALMTAARTASRALSRLAPSSQRLHVGVALAVSGDTATSLIERAGQGLHLDCLAILTPAGAARAAGLHVSAGS